MTELKECIELVATLAYRLKKQTDKWVDAFYEEHNESQQIRKREVFNIETAVPIVTAFQIVHVMSFIHLKKYIEESQTSAFINVLIESLYGPP